jgi:hypothetical protein
MNATPEAARLLQVLEREGASPRFLAGFDAADPETRRLVFAWLVLGRARSASVSNVPRSGLQKQKNGRREQSPATVSG